MWIKSENGGPGNPEIGCITEEVKEFRASHPNGARIKEIERRIVIYAKYISIADAMAAMTKERQIDTKKV
jgi:hypothetical protein